MNISTIGKIAGLAVGAVIFSATSALAIDAQALGSAAVRSGPGVGFPAVDTLYAGEPVDVVECNPAGNWCRIFHTGPDGWVARSLLGPPGSAGQSGSSVQFGVTIPLPGGGSITFGTPGYNPPGSGYIPPGPKRVCVYDLPNYAGSSVCVNAGMSDTHISGFWNNRVTSLRVFGGAHIRLCQEANFGGFCNTFTSNRPLLGSALNNKASSYAVW